MVLTSEPKVCLFRGTLCRLMTNFKTRTTKCIFRSEARLARQSQSLLNVTYFGIVQWSGNKILSQFDPRMSSLALLEADRPSPLYVTGKNNVDDVFSVNGGCCCLSFMYGCGGNDGG